MPEYNIPMGSHDASDAWAGLDEFTRGYIEAAFFTYEDCEPGDPAAATFADISPNSLAAIRQECAEFQRKYAKAIEAATADDRQYDTERCGNDFWYTRNGHGVGFWDRRAITIRQQRGLDVLDKASRRYGEVYLYRGDDGLIYFE